MTDQTSPSSEPDARGDRPGPDDLAELQRQVAADRRELRRLKTRVDVQGDVPGVGFALLSRGAAALAAVLMSVGLLMKFFIPVSGDDKSLTLFQVVDPEYDPDLLDSDSAWNTGNGWYIPIVMVLICVVLIFSVSVAGGPGSQSRPRALLTVTEVFCWCLAIGCVFGFISLTGMRNIVAVPGGLVAILVGAVVAIFSCRLARIQA